MNMTVGPHPPAVYWRRRAIIGAPLLLILILFASCLAGGSDNQPTKKKAAASAPAPQTSHTCTQDDPCTPDPDPSASASQGAAVGAAALPSQPAASLTPSADADPTTTPTAEASGGITACADKDLTLTPVVDKAQYKVGQLPRFKMVITNSSAAKCTRDVGASQQELAVSRNGQRLWSSDDCSPNRSHDRRVLSPGEKRTYWLTWSGKTSSPGCPQTRTPVGAGSYHLTGRLATLHSAPVAFTMTP
jgi:hypothetical protein